MSKKPEIQIIHDYDGAFESLVNGWVKKKVASGKEFKHDIITITSGPYRRAAVGYISSEQDDGKKVIAFDFYAALRAGFGELTDKDIEELIELL
jgi:hypothetical protein